LPALIALLGVVGAIFLRGSGPEPRIPVPAVAAAQPLDEQHSLDEHWDDDDEYSEYTVDWSPLVESEPDGVAPPDDRPTDVLMPALVEIEAEPDDPPTEQMYLHVEHPLPAPADTWHGGPVETWQHVSDDLPAEPEPDLTPLDGAWRSSLDELVGASVDGQIGHAHNGFHTDQQSWFRPLEPPVTEDVQAEAQSGGRHSRPSRGRHSRED
ncbi:MAG: hypothetical protein ACSLE3_08335, partial [Microbacteriaceae bacterium]